MKQKNRAGRALCRLKAVILAMLTLWAVVVTAGSRTSREALSALQKSLPRQMLQWELGDYGGDDLLSPAVVMTLREVPLLLAARPAVAELWGQSEEAHPFEDLETAPMFPVEEVPVDVAPVEDNGVPAKTLIPSDPEGYTIFGQTCISNATDYDLEPESLRMPFAAALSATESGPQILIVHTHGSEAYTPVKTEGIVWSGDHRTTDSRYNVVRVGDEMAEVFGAAGIAVLHDRTLYDYPSYTGAYDRSLAAIENYLSQYPSIRFVLDVHRDAVEDTKGNQYKVISELQDGSAAAQLSLVVGSGGSGSPHPNWRENLKLAVAIQERILSEEQTLMRPILLRNIRYNQHVTTGSLLVEVGAAGNAPEEAVLAGRVFAQQMAALLKEMQQEI